MCRGLIEAHFHGGKKDQRGDGGVQKRTGKQITDLAAMRVDEGILSRPAAHCSLKEERVSSHHAGVVGERYRTESKVAFVEDQSDI